MEQELPPSPHFELEKLAEGVYAAIARENGAAVSNSGIVDIGDRTLVFDTFLTPRAATDLRVAAEFLTERQVTYVINSHWHNDHIRGNQIFPPETEIISTRSNQQLIRSEGAVELQDDAETASINLKNFEDQARREQTPHAQAETAYWINYYRAIAESVGKVKLRPPTWTFEGRLVFHGTRRSAELLSFGPGHTQDDTILSLPDDRIGFASDLLFVNFHPYFEEGDPVAWLNSLDRLEGLGLEKIVPGHGPVGDRADIRQLRKYIKDIQAAAAVIVKAGEAPQAVDRKKVPAAFKEWRGERFYYSNLRFLVQRQAAMSS